MEDTLELPIEKFLTLAPRVIQRLHTLGIKTVRELLYHFPRRYDDYSKIRPIRGLEKGEIVTICGIIKKIEGHHAWRKRMTIIEATIEDETGTIPALWFNQHYLLKTLKEGQTVNFSGKVSLGKRGLYMLQPEHELVGVKKNLRHTGRLVPIYPETYGMTSRWLRFIIQQALEKLPEHIPDNLPISILVSEKLVSLKTAIQNIHFPKTPEEAAEAEHRFSFEELLILQLMKHMSIAELKKTGAPKLDIPHEELNRLIGKLPFALTSAQKKCLQDIYEDLKKRHPMNRLVNGDVGSGKTVIAGLASAMAVKNGYQVAFMAPTEILARQHFHTIREIFKDEEFSIGLLTSSEKRVATPYGEADKADIVKGAASGTVHILIGTHALIQKNIQFKNLGLVVIDEQHRFGVKQRAELSKQRGHDSVPHFLSLTATPIPRTLTLALYGDLNISILDEMPKGRKKIITKIVSPERRDAAYEFVRKEITAGRQAFVICPRIEITENKEETGKKKKQLSLKQSEIKSVLEEHEKLSKKIFPDLTVSMLHGKMRPKEKEKTMNEFKNGTIDILVATSVIEVGIDIPNATIMMIEGAERFGLAQLHQFRGRVGRGAHQSYCLLFPSDGFMEWSERLKAVALSQNGFELAEKDLKLRGPGNIIGYEQSGISLPILKALSNPLLLERASKTAEKIIVEDPELKKYPLLKKRTAISGYTTHGE
ncbi:MAG: ATP-dependent DNA helicase RecG [Patescibacteria group bacterium]